MRVVTALAAVAALWVQPAQAGVFITASGQGVLTVIPGCLAGQATPECSFQNQITTTSIYNIFTNIPDKFIEPDGSIGVGIRAPGNCIFEDCLISIGDDGTFILSSFARPQQPAGFFSFSGMVLSRSENDDEFFSLNIVAVPEPSTWAMLLVGFGAIGLAMRRRKTIMPRLSKARVA